MLSIIQPLRYVEWPAQRGGGATNMEERMQSALAGILEDYERRQSREVSARKAEQAGQEKFLADATAVLNTIVASCFEAFSQELKRHNHACTIEVQKQDQSDKRSEV